MRYLIAGSGGIGGYFGARLAADGNEVIFLDRGPQREALQSDGIHILSAGGDLHVKPLEVYDDPHVVGLCDFVLFAVREPDTEAMVRLVKPHRAHDTAVVPLQFGFDRADRLGDSLSSTHVMGAYANVCAHLSEPGVIVHQGASARLVFGELDGRASWRQECLLAACVGARIEAHATDAVRDEVWANFVLRNPLEMLCALHECSVGEGMNDATVRARYERLLTEALGVAQAGGRLFDLTVDKLLRQAKTFPASEPSVMRTDLEHGRALEIESTVGALLRQAGTRSVPVPEHSRLLSELEALNRSLAQPGPSSPGCAS